MPAVQVRDFSQDTYDQIKAEAQMCGRSIMQQTKQIVLQHFAQQADGGQPVLASQSAPVEQPTFASQSAPVEQPTFASQASIGANPFLSEAFDTIEQRRERRAALMARIAQRSYPTAFMQEDPAQVIREMRNER